MTDDLDSWDPLAEEYKSPTFNRYNEGPGVNLPLECLPSFASDRKGIRMTKTLCIKNVPLSLTKTGLTNLFSNCGEVLSVSKLKPRQAYPDKTVAFVQYGKTEEALHAIERLHDRPPFFLKVDLAKMSASERSKMEAKVEEELNEIRRKVQAKRAESESSTAPRPSSACRAVSPSEPAVVTLQDLQDLKAELRSSGLGRTPSPSSSSSVDSFETGREFLGGGDTAWDDTQVTFCGRVGGEMVRSVTKAEGKGRCLLCNGPANFCCGDCDAPYCSRKCQMEDWPSHKDNCHNKSSSQSWTASAVGDGATVSCDRTEARVGAPQAGSSVEIPAEGETDGLGQL